MDNTPVDLVEDLRPGVPITIMPRISTCGLHLAGRKSETPSAAER